MGTAWCGILARYSVCMFWYAVAAAASNLVYQSRSIGYCLAAFSGCEGRRLA